MGHKKIEMALVQTEEEFGIIKESLANFGSWLKGKECRMQSCPETCDRKYRLAWGRRLLSADDGLNDADEAEAAIQTGSKAQWGGIKKAVTKVLPKKVYYDDCSRKNSCLAANAACKAKLDSLRAAVAALDKEVAAAKKVADAHSATAAQKAKYADLKQKDADAAKSLLDEAQSAVAARAKDLADSKKHQDNIKAYQASEVAKDAKAKAYTLREHAEEVKDLKEAQEEMAEANKAVDHATKAHAGQLAEQKAQNAKAAARVAKDAAELKAAEGAIAGFAETHHSAKAIAAKAKADAAPHRLLPTSRRMLSSFTRTSAMQPRRRLKWHLCRLARSLESSRSRWPTSGLGSRVRSAACSPARRHARGSTGSRGAAASSPQMT